MVRSRYGVALGAVAALGMAAVALTPSVKATGPVVSLDSGMVRGTETAGVEGFRGIPYAQPPWAPCAGATLSRSRTGAG